MKLILPIFLICFSTNLFSQTFTDSITMKKGFGAYQFYQGKQRLKLNQLAYKMKANDQAYQYFRSAESTYAVSSLIGGVGGFMVGWPIGTAIGGGDPSWGMAGIGAALIIVTIPLTQSFNKKAKQAIDTYNGGLRTSSFWDESELKFSMAGDGMGLRLSF